MKIRHDPSKQIVLLIDSGTGFGVVSVLTMDEVLGDLGYRALSGIIIDSLKEKQKNERL